MNELREKINEIVTLVSVFKKGKVSPDPVDAILDAVIAALPVISETPSPSRNAQILGKMEYRSEIVATLQSAKENKQ